MFPPFIIAIALITLCCYVFVKPEPLTVEGDAPKLDRTRTIIYLILFAFSIIIVFRLIPYWIGLIVIPAVLFFMDRHALQQVDYPLLLTFVCFFIFAGNMGRIDFIQQFFAWLLEKNTLLVSVLSCQFISNVPSAILLSQFTENYADLLIGVNIGGAGTLIASLASLITFREFTKNNPGQTVRYIEMFSAMNFGFLAVLTGAMAVI